MTNCAHEILAGGFKVGQVTSVGRKNLPLVKEV